MAAPIKVYNPPCTLSSMKIEKRLTQYLQFLEKGNYQDIVQLFTPDAVIRSPLYGELPASAFYEQLLSDTTQSKITLLNLFADESKRIGAAHFLYEWVLKEGIVTSFECVDVVHFSDSGKINQLTIIYDTYKTRQAFEEMKNEG